VTTVVVLGGARDFAQPLAECCARLLRQDPRNSSRTRKPKTSVRVACCASAWRNVKDLRQLSLSLSVPG
jgi:hypothetical protein